MYSLQRARLLTCESLWNSATVSFPLRFANFQVYKAVISLLKATRHGLEVERAFQSARAAAPKKAKAGTKVKKESEKSVSEQLAWLQQYAAMPLWARKQDQEWYRANSTELEERFESYRTVRYLGWAFVREV